MEPFKKKRGCGCPPGSKNKKVRRDENYTRGDPSVFEHAIARSTGSIVHSRRCTKCKMPGHNKRSCTSVPEEIEDADNTGTEVDEDDYEEYDDATEHTPLPETPLPEAPSPEALLPEALLPEAPSPETPSPEAPSSKAPSPKAPLSAQGKEFEGVPCNVRQIPATPTTVRVRSILEQLDDLDDNDPAFIRDDGSTNFFLEHGWGIGDPANREKTLEELEALVPDEQRALEEEEERCINAGQESIMDEELHQGKYSDAAAAFLPKGYQPYRCECLHPGGIINDFYSDLAHQYTRKYRKQR